MAGATPPWGTRTNRAVRHAECHFPSCEEAPVTVAGMCELHRRVVISSTGSWLEAS